MNIELTPVNFVGYGGLITIIIGTLVHFVYTVYHAYTYEKE